MATFGAFSFSATNARKGAKVNEKFLYVGNARSMLDLDAKHEEGREEGKQARIRRENKTKMSNRFFVCVAQAKHRCCLDSHKHIKTSARIKEPSKLD